MKLRLNLATRPQSNNRPFLAGAVVAGVLALVALLLLAHSAYTSWVASREIRAEMAQVESRVRVDQDQHEELERYFRQASARNVIDRSAFLNSLIAERSFPWTKILTDLGQILPPGVRVISIAPRLDNGRAQVTLQVGSTNEDAKLQFLEAIEKSSAFSGLVVKSEHHPDQLESPDRVILDLTVWYTTAPTVPPAPSPALSEAEVKPSEAPKATAPSEARAPLPKPKVLPPPSVANVMPSAPKPPSSKATAPSPSEAPKATAPPPSVVSVNHGFGAIRSVNLAASNGRAEVTITGSSPLAYHTMHLRNPDRLVLNFADTRLTVARKNIASNLVPVQDIRLGQFTPQISRVVIDLSGPITYQIKVDGNNVVVALAPRVNGR